MLHPEDPTKFDIAFAWFLRIFSWTVYPYLILLIIYLIAKEY